MGPCRMILTAVELFLAFALAIIGYSIFKGYIVLQIYSFPDSTQAYPAYSSENLGMRTRDEDATLFLDYAFITVIVFITLLGIIGMSFNLWKEPATSRRLEQNSNQDLADRLVVDETDDVDENANDLEIPDLDEVIVTTDPREKCE